MLNLIKNLLQDYFQFLRKPNPNPRHEKIKGKKKWQILLFSFLLNFLLVAPFAFIIYLISEHSNLDFDNHAVGAMTNEYSLSILILLGGVIVPFIEEVIFRLPLNYKRNYLFKFVGFIIGKNTVKNFWFKYYTVFFYLFIIAFGLVHISNYKDESLGILLLAPILVLPQLIVGTILSYLRMKLGFIWGFLNHALFNCTLFLFAFFFNVEEKAHLDTDDFYLKIEVAESKFGHKEQIHVNNDFDFLTEINTQYARYDQIAKKLEWDTLEVKKNNQHFHIDFKIKRLGFDVDSVLQTHLKEIIADQ